MHERNYMYGFGSKLDTSSNPKPTSMISIGASPPIGEALIEMSLETWAHAIVRMESNMATSDFSH